ncbi:MAG: transglutaminase domain-containing protein [Chloroflexi bacterium]|nr:transglutaminase domain-containing protein [Chloroflexota bacterium]
MSPAAPFSRRALSRRLVPYEGWSTVALVSLLLLTVAWTMEATHWVPQMPSLSRAILLAMVTAFVFAKLPLPGLLLHPLSLVLGAGVGVWQTGRQVPGLGLGIVDRAREVIERLDLWLGAARFGTISVDILPFVAMLVAILWLTGYLTAWFAFRGKVWLPVIPGGIVLLVTLNYTMGKHLTYFALYLLLALVLVARLNHLKQRRHWARSGVTQGEGVALSFITEAFAFALAALLLVWQLPVVRPDTPVRQAWAQFSGPWDNFQSEFNRVFASTSSLKPMPMHTFGDTLPFRGAISLGSQVSLRVESTYQGYWRAKAYDTYTSQGWQSSPLEPRPLVLDGEEEPGATYAKRRPVTQRVHVGFDTNLVFAAGEPVSVSLPSAAASLPPAQFTLPLTGLSVTVEDSRGRRITLLRDPRPSEHYLPPDLVALSQQLSRQWASGQTLNDLRASLPPDLRVESIALDGIAAPSDVSDRLPVRDPRRDVGLVVRRTENPPDRLAVVVQDRLRVGQDYVVTSLVSTATPEDLRQAGTDYPTWVTDRYLQLPSSLPKRVRDLAVQLGRSENNPYDKAQAIIDYLHKIPYTQDIQPPPFNHDAVDFFLFEQRRGYSDYYGSAMTVLLRAAGVPARVAVGYNSGDLERQGGAFVVREHHAHAWVEAFFPGYGWMEFEPTPGRGTPPAAEVAPDELDDLLGALGEEEFLEEDDFFPSGVFPLTSGSASGPPVPVAPVVVLGLAALAAGATWWTWRRGLSGLDPAACAYEKTCRLSWLTGMGPRPEQTPAEFGHALAGKLPWLQPSIESIVGGYAGARYGGRSPDAKQAMALDSAWRRVRGALLGHFVPRRRSGFPTRPTHGTRLG